MQSTQKNFSREASNLAKPANDEAEFSQEQILSLIKPLSRQQNTIYRNKVLTRKRKRSKHPLRELRIRAGYTLEELAETTHMSPSYLSRLESGTRRLNADILQRLAVALSCNPGDLLPYSNTYGVNRSVETDQQFTGPTPGHDLPVYRLTGTQNNSGQIHAETIEQWIARPGELSGIMGAFACVIADNNFGPRYGEGDKILLHPTAPLASQCSVLAVTNDNQAFIGRFLGWDADSPTSTPSKLMLEVTNAKAGEVQQTKKMTFDRTQLKGTYRIIGSFEAA